MINTIYDFWSRTDVTNGIDFTLISGALRNVLIK